MSDVNILNSWSTVTPSYKAFQNTLTFYAYSGDETLLGLQQTPPTEGHYTADGLTDNIKGTNLGPGYYGSWIKRETTINVDANMTRCVYYMSNKVNGYDIEGTRCYVQFANVLQGTSAFPIGSWSLETDSGQVIASGTDVEPGAFIEVNFINDYDTVNFRFIINLEGEPGSVGHWYYLPYGETQITTSERTWVLRTEIPGGLFMSYWKHSSGFAYNFFASNELVYPETNMIALYINYYTYASTQHWSDVFPNNYISYDTTTGKIYRNEAISGQSQWDSFVSMFCQEVGATGYNSVDEAVSDLYGTPFGYHTNRLNSVRGTLLECSMFSDISQTFPGPSNDVQGGTLGTFDDSTDTNTVPTLPTTDSAIISGGKSVGAFSIFRLTESQYQYVRECLFSTDFFTNIKNYFTKPLDGIVSLGRLPFLPMGYSTSDIYIGSVALEKNNTPAIGTPIDRYYEFDCGTVEVLPYWDTALDYDPYTRAVVNLPFIGRRQIDADLIMGKTLGIIYHIDVITGGCIAYLTANNDLLDQYSGNMLTVAPLSGEDFSRVYGAILTSVASSAVSATLSGNPIGGVASAVSGVANSMLHSKRDFAGNVNFGGSTAYLENLQPYVEIIRPVQNKPRDYDKFKGYVSTVTGLLGECSGYTEVLDIHLENITATENEKSEILNLLKSGVII